MEELPLLYSGCRTGSLCPKQLAGVPRKGSACCLFHKDVYLHSNLHEAEAILQASVVTFCSISPIQKSEPDQTHCWIETHRSQHTKVAHYLATFQLQGSHSHGEGAFQKAVGQRRRKDHSLQDSGPLQSKAQLLLYPCPCRTDIWQPESLPS